MSNHKQFGVWMDKENATIVGRENVETGAFKILASIHGEHVAPNTQKHAHNQEQMLQNKFFKEITTHMQNADVVHVIGNAQAQEQFNHYLAETAQFKNAATSDSTSDRMSDEKLVAFFSEHFH